MVYPIRRHRSPQPPQPYRTNRFPQQRHARPAGAGGEQLRNSWQPMLSKGVNGVSKTLGNVQQVLDVVQSTTPIIQQYGPMVKNIPAMYRMFKAFKDIETTDDETPKTNNNPTIATKKQEMTSPATSRSKNNSEGKSTPKLFF